MTARELPTVDLPRLKLVLAAIDGDQEVRNWFLDQGHPENGVFMSGAHPAADHRLEEALACIKYGNWRPNPKAVQRVVQRAIYHHLAHNEGLAATAKRIRKMLAVRLRQRLCLVEVRGLEPFDGVLRFAEYRFGRLDALLVDEGQTVPAKLDFTVEGKPMAVMFLLQAPKKSDKISQLARRRAEEALDLLATTYCRRTFDTGSPWELQPGNRVWTWHKNHMSSASISRPWMEGVPYGIAQDTLQARGQWRRQAAADGYAALPKGDLRESLQLAYTTLGAAVRLAPNAPAAIARAWTAIEVAFAPRGGPGKRGSKAVANRILMAALDQGSLGGPVDLANFYLSRNQVVHEGRRIAWEQSEADKRLTHLYAQLDALTTFCLKRGLTTKIALMQGLRQQPIAVAEARKWVQDQQAQLVPRLKSPVTELRERAQATKKMWDDVLAAFAPDGDLQAQVKNERRRRP